MTDKRTCLIERGKLVAVFSQAAIGKEGEREAKTG